jgi:hypothetical protein
MYPGRCHTSLIAATWKSSALSSEVGRKLSGAMATASLLLSSSLPAAAAAAAEKSNLMSEQIQQVDCCNMATMSTTAHNIDKHLTMNITLHIRKQRSALLLKATSQRRPIL